MESSLHYVPFFVLQAFLHLVMTAFSKRCIWETNFLLCMLIYFPSIGVYWLQYNTRELSQAGHAWDKLLRLVSRSGSWLTEELGGGRGRCFTFLSIHLS